MSSTTSRSPLRHGVAVVVALVSAVAGAVLASPPAQAAALTNTVRPSIRATASGTTCVLTADRGTWTPTPTSYAYQWYVAGAAVAGATTASYTVATADAGKVVGLRVTAARAGYTPTPAQAGASLPVRVHGRLAGRTSGYQWAADGVPISGARCRRTRSARAPWAPG